MGCNIDAGHRFYLMHVIIGILPKFALERSGMKPSREIITDGPYRELEDMNFIMGTVLMKSFCGVINSRVHSAFTSIDIQVVGRGLRFSL